MSTVGKSVRLYAWKPNYHIFEIVQGEVNSRIFEIQLFESTSPINLDNCLVMFYAVKPDSTKIYVECRITDAESGNIKVVLPEQIATVSGTVSCWIQVIGNTGEDLRFDGMTIEVTECSITEGVCSSSDFAALLLAAERATDALEISEDAMDLAEGASEKVQIAVTMAETAAPYILNGNWWVRDTDTGVRAQAGSVVYFGSDNPPEHADVWINPEGEAYLPTDTSMSDTSTNPVQNKVIKQYIDNLVGDIETVLDNIIVLQNNYIGGES